MQLLLSSGKLCALSVSVKYLQVIYDHSGVLNNNILFVSCACHHVAGIMCLIRAACLCLPKEQGGADESRRPLGSLHPAPCAQLGGGWESDYASLTR